MKLKQTQSLLKLLGLTGLVIALNACSSEPSPWTKTDSPWDQRRATDVEAPAADMYKADLEMASEPAAEVELSYQAESVESFAPAEAVMEEPVVVEEAVAVETGTLMDYPANYFTVQLMASVDVDRVYRFADQNQLSTQYVVPTIRDDMTWYVLLLDVYPDYASAVAGKDDIASLLNTQPWVRSVGSVQKLMQ